MSGEISISQTSVGGEVRARGVCVWRRVPTTYNGGVFFRKGVVGLMGSNFRAKRFTGAGYFPSFLMTVFTFLDATLAANSCRP